MLSVFLVLFCLTTPHTSPEHAIYLSVLEIDKHEIKVKVFTDDLNDAIKNDSSSIEGYFQKKILLHVNEEPLNFGLKNLTEEGDSYWITFDLEKPDNWGSIYLKADYLMELFPDQTNVVKVLGKTTQYFRLNQITPSCQFNW